MDLDPVNRTLYWTDRGDPPRGNTVNRAPMDPETENGKEPGSNRRTLLVAQGNLTGIAYAEVPSGDEQAARSI